MNNLELSEYEMKELERPISYKRREKEVDRKFCKKMVKSLKRALKVRS